MINFLSQIQQEKQAAQASKGSKVPAITTKHTKKPAKANNPSPQPHLPQLYHLQLHLLKFQGNYPGLPAH
ncbi:hypothetical protein DSO57_1022534 [Entomophthora muscae]|uniref:Uncharacterized protein n=1 Tax=Entomophthora muscae TaxID=34485 RepID=A0ACC2RU65_9FUNG|nr:hypothetical protein DSO57_1022534 [Entomophthora muscae]